jgi:outer membrane receptor protein involved in Fe transport
LAALQELGVSTNPTGYASDSLWNYEIGSKNRLFSDRLQIQTAIYHMDWSALQEPIYVPACATGFTTNVGKAKSDGVDFQLKAVPIANVQAGLAVGYNNARITQTVAIPSGGIVVSNGDQIDQVHAPWTIAEILEYDFRIFGSQLAYVRIDDEYHSKNPGPFTFQNPEAVSYNPLLKVPQSQNRLNLHVGTTVNGWEVAFFGTNLANDHPLLYFNPPSQEPALGIEDTLPPRTFGVTGIHRW